MKVIDEKGKLFGKLNLIDLLVLILIVAAVVVVGMKVLGGGEEAAPVTQLTYTVRVTARNEKLVEQLAQYVDTATGRRDQLMAGGNMVDAYVVDFWTEPTKYNRTGNYSIEVYDAQQAADAGLTDICFVIEANVSNAVTNEVGTQEVRIGKAHIVKTAHIEFDAGVVESCTWKSVG